MSNSSGGMKDRTRLLIVLGVLSLFSIYGLLFGWGFSTGATGPLEEAYWVGVGAGAMVGITASLGFFMLYLRMKGALNGPIFGYILDTLGLEREWPGLSFKPRLDSLPLENQNALLALERAVLDGKLDADTQDALTAALGIPKADPRRQP